MMNLILLGGNHKSNKEWTKKVEKSLKHMFESTHVQAYEHWDEKAGTMDINQELEKLEKTAKDLDELVIFGKSAGAILALKGMYKRVISPVKCIFVGTAIYWGRACGFDVDIWLENYEVPTLFIQKKEDPAIFHKDLNELLLQKGVKNYKTIKIPGKEHFYEDVNLLRRSIREFIT